MAGSKHSSLPASRDVHLRTSFVVIPLQLSILAVVLAVGRVVADTFLEGSYSQECDVASGTDG